MSVLILGAGVIGSTLAYYLAKIGQEVIVLERQSDVALETSFANAGQISYGYSSPWAAPNVPFKAIKWLLQKHAPLAIKPDFTLFQLEWIIKFLQNCRNKPYSINKERMLRLAQYSQSCLHNLCYDENIDYNGRKLGTLQIFRSIAQLEAIIKKDIPILQQTNINYKILNKNELGLVEPALANIEYKLVGGLHLPQDETGDCFTFTNQIKQKAQALGAKFYFNHHIEKLLIKYQQGKKQVYGALANNQEFIADNIVIALGSYSRSLLQEIVKIPVYPIKGYSITAEITDESMAPQSTILDESYKIALTRLGTKIRVGGMANIGGFNKTIESSKINTLNFILEDLFPYAYSHTRSEWTGLRPSTPDGTPIIGAVNNIENLWLNTGHGTLGWTMACGSGKLLADLILQKNTDIKANDLSLDRYLKN